MTPQCADPNAPQYPCVVCGKTVYTCERAVAVNSDYRCPAHPDGVETKSGWVCSEKCYDAMEEGK